MFHKKEFDKVIKELEMIDESVKIKHIPRSQWTDEMVKGKILLWQIPPNTAKLLYSFVKLRKPSIVLEFGTSGGYSGLWIARALEENDQGILHTIEFSEYRANIARENFSKAKLDHRIILHRGKIREFITDDNISPIDFLFIDADKPNYLNHFEMVEERLSKGAVVLVDNILDNPKKVQNFVEYMKAHKNFSTTIFEMDNGLLFSIKK